MSTPVSELKNRFSVPGLCFEQGAGGLTKLVIQTPQASGELFLHGAHVTSWQPAGEDAVLWMGGQSCFEPGKAIRGGVPICFPWFGPHPTEPSWPAHGYARIREWELIGAAATTDGGIAVALDQTIDQFRVQFQVEFAHVLTMTLRTELLPHQTEACRFEEALHTYLAVGDVRSAVICGLENCPYIDKMEQAAKKPATGSPVVLHDETDRIYFHDNAPCVLVDPTKGRTVTVRKTGSRSTVIWNPWVSKSSRMPDFGNNEWPEMVCIETANIGADAIELQPGQTQEMQTVISVDRIVG